MSSDLIETERIARSYFKAWTRRDTEATRALLAEDFHFAASDVRVEGRDAVLEAGAFPDDATTRMVAAAYQGDVAFQMYDASKGDRTVRIVEQLSIRDGHVASSIFVTDMTAFMGLMTP